MEPELRIQVSVLKHLTYELLISSSRLKLVAHRGERVVRSIFEALSKKGGALLLPGDFGQRYSQADEAQRPRVICDFIASMTDRYAVEFYARLTSDTFNTMFKPL
jgi:dGTPase